MTELRIDKWLWFARFCKSRNLAQHWIDGGEVSLNGVVVVKSSAYVRVGDLVEMPRGGKLRHQVRVLALAEKRGGAPQAQTLYESVAITKV